MKIKVKLFPKSQKDRIHGWDEHGNLRIYVCAPPVDEKANVSMIKLLAKTYKFAKSCVKIEKGRHSRIKILEIPEVELLKLKKKETI
ncbi:MAG: DUF167 domain-containing protein [bacterium]